MKELLLFFNNYLHDFCAALLLVSALSTLFFYKKLPENPQKQTLDYFLQVYRKLVRLGWISLIFTILLGIPRTLSYKSMEWSVSLGNKQIPLLAAKHILLFSVVGTGMFFWMRLHSKVKLLQRIHNGWQRELYEKFSCCESKDVLP